MNQTGVYIGRLEWLALLAVIALLILCKFAPPLWAAVRPRPNQESELEQYRRKQAS